MARRTGLPSGPVRPLAIAAAAVVAMGGTGCDRTDAQQELTDAIAATADDPFTFRLSARADRTALERLGDDAVPAADFFGTAGIEGARDPDGRLRAELYLGGSDGLLEVVTGPGEPLLLRTGLADMLGLGDADPAEQLGPALDARGVDPAARDALAVSFAGGWVALTDVDDIGELLDAAAAQDPDAAGLAPRLDDLLDAIRVTGARDAGEVRRLTVDVAAGPLLTPFGADSEATLPGTVDLRGGRVLEVRLALGGGALGLAGAPDVDGAEAPDDAEAPGGRDAPGVVELILRIDPADEPVVPRPDAGASLTAAELLELVELLQPEAVPAP